MSSDSDSDTNENTTLLQTVVRDRLIQKQQRLPPKSLLNTTPHDFTQYAHMNIKSPHHNDDIQDYNNNDNNINNQDVSEDRINNYISDSRRNPMTGKPYYRIERRPRGDIPRKEICLILFLFCIGLIFLYNGINQYFTTGEDYGPFFGIAFLTLCPSSYQLIILFCAIFELNNITFNDIPRAPGWT